MAEAVDILISVKTVGVDGLHAVQKGMTDVGKSTALTTVASNKQLTAWEQSNKALNTQIPILKTFAPLMSLTGMAITSVGAAITAMGVGLLKAADAFGSLQIGTMMLGVELNRQTIGPMMTYAMTSKMLTDLSLKTGESQKGLMAAFNATGNASLSLAWKEQTVIDAARIRALTGMDLVEVTKTLIAAYTGEEIVRDKANAQMKKGEDAYRERIRQLEAMADAAAAATVAHEKLATQGVEKLTTALGPAGLSLKSYWQDFLGVVGSAAEWLSTFNPGAARPTLPVAAAGIAPLPVTLPPFPLATKPGVTMGPAPTGAPETAEINVNMDGAPFLKMIYNKLMDEVRVLGGW